MPRQIAHAKAGLRLFAAMALAFGSAARADVAGAIDCYCTDKGGARIELGEMICLQVDGRMFTAQCQMSLNVPMWREVRQGCLTSSAAPMSRAGSHSLQPGVDPRFVHAPI